MIGELAAAVLGVASLGIGGAVVLHEASLRQRRLGTWTTLELRFGRDLSVDATTGALGLIGALPAGITVVLEVRADHDGIRHFISSDGTTLDALAGPFRALLPGGRLAPCDDPAMPDAGAGVSVGLASAEPVLRQDAVGQAVSSLLAALQPLRRGEVVALRWVLAAGRRPVAEARAAEPDRRLPEHRRAWRVKASGPLLTGSGSVGVVAKDRPRARQLLGRVTAVLRTRSTGYGHVRTTVRRGAALTRVTRQQTLRGGDQYAPAELTALIGWPIGVTSLPGVTVGASPLLIASPQIPSAGRVVGIGTHPSSARPIAQPLLGALSHTLIVGPTGVGKSALITNLAARDIAAGRGLLLIDGKGDTAKSVLEQVPRGRWDDVVLLDCASRGPLPGLRVFDGPEPELAADVALSVLSELFRDSWGPLSERYLRAALVAVAHDPLGTIADLPYVYADDAYRRRLVPRIGDPLLRGVFASFEAMGPAERSNQLAAAAGKLSSLLSRPAVRTVLGQPDGGLDLDWALAEGQIVVVSLAPTRIGSMAARLIAALVVHRLFQATLARTELPVAERTPFLVYLDEPRTLADIRLPIDAMLEMARGLGVGVVLAPQSITQLSGALRDAAMTNVASRIVFTQNADDARLLARDLPGVRPEDLMDLDRFEAIARIGLGSGDKAAPVSLRTSPPPKPLSTAAAVRDHAARLGKTTSEVDARLAERHTASVKSAPVGRARRSA